MSSSIDKEDKAIPIATHSNMCEKKTDNCSATDLCEDTMTSFICIPCPKYHVPTSDRDKCKLGECPSNYIPSDNGETCISGCRRNYHMKMTSNGPHCKADVCAPSGQIVAEQKINSLEGGLRHEILPGDRFGASVAGVGDLDGNGVADLAVGSSQHETTVGTLGFGSVYILFLNTDNTVGSHTVIGTSFNGEHPVGGLSTAMSQHDFFGASLACLGDLDGNGTPDLLVGAPGDDDGGADRGALYVLFLEPTGLVKGTRKISAAQGGLGLDLGDNDMFGMEVSFVGRAADKGGVDVVVATYGGGGGAHAAAAGAAAAVVYFMRLNLDGTVKTAFQLWALGSMAGEGGFLSERRLSDMAAVGDLDGNGEVDIVVGVPMVRFYSQNHTGWVVVLLMQPETEEGGGGGVIIPRNNKHRLIRSVDDGGGGEAAKPLLHRYAFGSSVAALGDLDGDGIPDLAVGDTGEIKDIPGQDATSSATLQYTGEVHLLLLDRIGGVKGKHVISVNGGGGFVGPLTPRDDFGSAVATVVERGDSEEGVVTLVVGASRDPATMEEGGAVYILTVPPGFVEVCPGEDEKCISNSGTDSDGYSCG